MDKIKLEPKKRLLLLLLAIVVIGGIGAIVFLTASTKVTLDAAVKGDIHRAIVGTGKVESERRLLLKAPGSSEVLSIFVEVGDEVLAGDSLVSMDDSTLDYQLRSLEYQIKSLESNIAYLAAPYNELTLENYEGSVKIARENSLKSQDDYDKGKTLFEMGAISQSELDSLELQSTVAQMNYIMALNESDTASRGGDTDVVQQYRFQLESLVAQLESLEVQIQKYEIKAPFDGIVSDLFVEEGELVAALSPVVQVHENDYYVASRLFEEDLVLMEMKAPVAITYDTTVVEGEIRRIHPMIQTVISDLGVAQQKGLVEIEVDEKFHLLGREVALTFMLNRRQEVLTVAKEAVFRQDQKDYVFIVLENKARLTEVLVGARGDRRYEILEGLEENDQVIILSTEDVIEDGDRISY